MKNIFILLNLLISSLVFAQSDEDYQKADSIFKKSELKYDSLKLNSVELNAQLDKIMYLEMFFNKLLYEDNYKDKYKIKEIVSEYNEYLPKNKNYEKFYNDKILLIKSMRHFVFSEKYNLLKIRRKEIEFHYNQLIKIEKEKINRIDNRIIYLLTLEKIPIEDYNIMSKVDQNNLINKLEEKYKK